MHTENKFSECTKIDIVIMDASTEILPQQMVILQYEASFRIQEVEANVTISGRNASNRFKIFKGSDLFLERKTKMGWP